MKNIPTELFTVKEKKSRQNTGIDYMNDTLDAKITLLVAYRERTEFILISSERTCFKYEIHLVSNKDMFVNSSPQR